ncbi:MULTISPECIES: amidohydrolase [unclassified Massilia]|uniref:amidohydrolase n=1 Tax=unclassified Massilia TaxID=2609279 RepID=UPI00177AA9DB|nr:MULTISPECIES: amidohydrolase [unclassified Massilia]MBD8532884.1 amidohydrolase [Massilia sp. CFBP 13647]MBD8676245.1 amidohydrolase [Massilia sp. CFBP 13721]
MQSSLKQCSAFVLAALASFGAQADTVIVNANGYTLNAKGDLVQFAALAFDDKGKILAVGTAADVAAKAPGARQVDMQGKTVLPGLIDAHGHVFGLGQMLTQLDLSQTTSLEGALKAIGDYARANQNQAWLRGRGWNQENWKLGRFPSAADVDNVVSDKPVWFERVDGHAGWANSRALEAAGITDKTPDPAGGKIMRDANGKATGVLVDAAQDLVTKVLPAQTEAEGRVALDRALGALARVGVTSTHDAGLGVAEDRLYRAYADQGKLTARIYGMIGGTEKDFDALAKNGPLKTYGNDMYALRAVKLYSDGALGSRGAALIKPYSDEPHSHGLLFYKLEQMDAMMKKAMARGYQVNVHAIGDAGNHQILDIYKKELGVTKSAAQRHRIEHAQVVTPADIVRFKTLGIIPSMQPTHATSDKNMAESRVGPERIKGAYAWRTFLHQGSRIACGSDFPVESPNPFFGIHAAVTRQDASGQPIAGWYPNQAMSLKEAFRCFTLDAAYAGHAENSLGSLEPGKWADFIVVDQDLFKVSTYDIYKTGVLQTWVAGKAVFTK